MTFASVSTYLEQRVARNGASPLVTWYDVASGARVELSTKTFANWVDKSVNLLTSMDIDEQPRVAHLLLLSDPLHWVSLVWTAAIWQLGGTVVAHDRAGDLGDCNAAIVGPTDSFPVPGVETIACSLHPLGAPLTERHSGVTDYAEALSQPDVHWAAPIGDDYCFVNSEHQSWQALADIRPNDERVLLSEASDPWSFVQRALVAPLAGNGSVVLAPGASDEQLTRIAAQEKAVRAARA